jgi:predicted HAD superfamily Cof-like phosphohydrolase
MSFNDKIQKFNSMYDLARPTSPSLKGVGDWQKRVINFQDILKEEIEEGDEIVEGSTTHVDVLTSLADWLGDIIVYAWSEAARYGIPTEQVLDIIMESNFSKLDENGKPIMDDRGKVLKGPGYWKPEPKIKQLLLDKGAK